MVVKIIESMLKLRTDKYWIKYDEYRRKRIMQEILELRDDESQEQEKDDKVEKKKFFEVDIETKTEKKDVTAKAVTYNDLATELVTTKN